MAKNNQSATESKQELQRLLSTTAGEDALSGGNALAYARAIALVEGVVAVVSDLKQGRSVIIQGAFARQLGLESYSSENSIWEERILSLMSPSEQEQKYIAELRFFHFLRRLPRRQRGDYYLMTKLKFMLPDGRAQEVLHRMYYLYGRDSETVRYAVCLYGPRVSDFPGKSCAVNSVTGLTEDLTTVTNAEILSRRERQVLQLIDTGLKSSEIAERLSISLHTVSRHRQEILSKLQVKNSHEACRLAKSMGLI